VQNGADWLGAPFAAPPLNTYWLHIVMPGKIGQGREGFLDEWSYGCIRAVAAYIVKHATLNGFAPVRRDVRYLVGAGVENCTGYCGHGDVEGAWHKSGGHTDPGPDFPWDVLEQEIVKLTVPVGVEMEDDVKASHTWRDQRFYNEFVVFDNGEVLPLSPSTKALYKDVPAIVEQHDQTLDSLLAKSGLTRASLVGA
jgi:hypothetical protein